MTSQTKIDFFYKSDTNNKKYQLKRYFYLIWEDVYRPNVSAYWLENKPEKINFIELVHCNYIKKGYYFYLCGWFRNHDDKEYVLMKEKMYNIYLYLHHLSLNHMNSILQDLINRNYKNALILKPLLQILHIYRIQ